MRLGGDEAQDWTDKAHFYRTAALAMRNILVDRARQKTAIKRGRNTVTLTRPAAP